MNPTSILWTSNAPWTTSAYGQQTAMLVPRIKGLGHNVAVSAFYGLEGALVPWGDIPCYPTDWTRFGGLLVGGYAQHHFGGDRSNGLVFTFQDLWPLLPFVQGMQGLRFVCWAPVDHDPCPPKVAEFIRQTKARTVALSRHGQMSLEREGFENVLYAPCAVDTQIFKPMRDVRDEIRASLGLPQDAFVVGMVACNQGWPSRKCYPSAFEAFKRFQEKHSDAILFVHADVFGRNNGVNLVELAAACGIPTGAMHTSDQMAFYLGLPPQAVAQVINTFNVSLLPSMGEGFGIPTVESQACGVPVIVSDFTSSTELCEAGWLLEGQRFWNQTQSSFQFLPDTAAIVDALEQAYDQAETMGGQAVEFAQAYDVNRVFEEHWLPVLDDVTAPREIEPLKLAA